MPIESLSSLYAMLKTPHFLLFTMWVALSIKIYLITLLVPKGLRTSSFKLPWLFLLLILLGSMVGDVAWISKLTRQIFFPWIPYGLHIFIVRCSWAAMVMQYQFLALFIESFVHKKYRLNLWQKFTTALSGATIFYFIYIAFFDNNLTDEAERYAALADASLQSSLELNIIRYVSLYLLAIVILPALFFTFKNIRTEKLPKILKIQLTVLISYLLCPFLLAECIIAAQHFFHQQIYESSILGVSTLLISYSIFYCIQKVLGLRFLNFDKHLHAKQRANFVDTFKEVLEQLSKVSGIHELSQVTQTFLKKSLTIPHKKVTLIVRNDSSKMQFQQLHSIEQFIEDFMGTHDNDICDFIKKSQILIYDELTFNNFYDEDKRRSALIHFLEKINADLFLPIYQKQKVIAYMVIEFNARPNKLYSIVDHDEMLVFANYLGNIINLLQNRNLDLLVQQEKELKEELHNKEQEIMQYKESMRSFLRMNNQKDIGIIFYKNRRFIFGNQAAKELIKINLNLQEGHPLSKAIREVGSQVEEYKISKTTFSTDADGKKIIISGVPNLEQNNVIITIYHPEISDIIKKQISFLKDPTKWDYLLYLETTKSGQLINQLIPGSGEVLLNFKIDLLKIGMSNNALLLDLPEEDTKAMVELIHHINLRETLHTISLHEPVKDNDYLIKIFGINPIFGIKTTERPLFEKLDNIGTLFIKNVDFLDKETQEYLAEYLKTGFWGTFKSDQKNQGNIRIICSSDKNLAALVEENRFSKTLYEELKKTSLSMPPLATLPASELHNLAEGFSAQTVKTDDFKNILELNEKEKDKLVGARPVSLIELKTKVQNLLIHKSKKHNIYEETKFQPVHVSNDPELLQAADLGKHALRNEKVMAMLWNKFKNQNQIAAFLGVNRSSVNRRCKEYNLE